MSFFDIILLLIWSGFVFYGLFFGLIKTIGTFLGAIIGIWLSSVYYLEFYHYISFVFGSYENIGKVFSFIILFGIINKIAAFLFALADKIFGILSIIPFLKSFNRLFGAILGFLIGGIVLGMIIYVASKYTLLNSLLGVLMVKSKIIPVLMIFVNILKPILPDVLVKIKSIL